MCECGFNHGDLQVEDYIQKGAATRDPVVFAELKRFCINQLAGSIAAINDLDIEHLNSFKPDQYKKDKETALNTAEIIKAAKDGELCLRVFDAFMHEAMAKEIIAVMDEEKPVMMLDLSFLVPRSKRARGSLTS